MPFDLLIRCGLLALGSGAPGRPAIRHGAETGERPGPPLRRDA